MPDWYETFDDSLWLPRDETAPRQAQFIQRALNLRHGDRVLDCPCGAGRIAIELAKAGMRVTGVDFKPRFTEEARDKFRRASLAGHFSIGDMRELSFDRQFEAAFNWSGSFGYFSDDENLQVLRGLAEAVLPYGRVLVDQPNREFILANFKQMIEQNGVIIFNRWNERDERIESNWIVERNGERIESPLSMRLYTLDQMRELFEQAGLSLTDAYGGADRGRLGPNSRRLIAVGIRSA
jgi:SAM-dependent methyltransferase